MDAARSSRDPSATDAEAGTAPIAASLSKAAKTIAGHYLRRILTARVYDVAIESPLEPAKNLSRRLNNHVFLKREDCQPVFSFKLRGAYNKMAHLSPEALQRGVICASAGNHAQGVALSARRLGVRAVIVMPVTTPKLKVDAVHALGGEVVLHGDSYSDAYAHAVELEKEQGLTFVHPFDDPDVIAGQGTIAMEILRQHQGPIDAVFVAIGGGGLISGVAAYIKALRPEIKVIGVQAADSDAMIRSVRAGRRVTLSDVGLFADGTAVKLVGAETFRIARALVDDYVTVDTDAACAAIKDVFQDTRSILEPSGALGVAAIKQYVETIKDVFQDTRSILEPSGALGVAAIKQYVETHKLRGRTFVAVTCGANMNFDRLRFVAERAEFGEQREALYAITIPEERGSFKRLCALIGPPGSQPRQVTEFNYRISEADKAHVFVGISIARRDEAEKIARHFDRHGFPTVNLTGDELAKEHVRHMVGGRSELAHDERLFRFVFPERPGALMRFLDSMHPDWNISLFHYRNQGADYGRILVGLQVPDRDRKALAQFLDSLAYPWVEETDNPVYRLFLR
jgi:threonine dehydratase